MTGNSWIPCLPFIAETTVARLEVLDRIPAAHGCPFPRVTIKEKDGTTSSHLVITVTNDDWWGTPRLVPAPEDPSDPKVIRRRFQEALATLRGPEPVFLPPVAVKPGKRAARRTGARFREQRTR
jgi:hypothetical protein